MAGGKRGQTGGTSLKYQSFHAKRVVGGGKKPLPEPTTVQHVFVMLIMHVCRRVVLVDPEVKVPIYLGALVFGSLVSDFLPMPRSYFQQKTNVFNQYFVKWGWGWTLLILGLYVGMTSWTYCCGNVDRVRKHFYRLLVGTVSWFCWTKSFVLIESLTASCYNEKFMTRSSCIKHGSAWRGFDISGHAFLLIYCSLLIAEEAKSIRGWERIGELMLNQEYDEDSPLKPLKQHELDQLEKYYDLFTPYVRCLFIGLTLFVVLWDVMLVATIMYYHSMVQKFMGGVIAVLMWFFTYRWWYHLPSSPGLPGQGPFKYSDAATQRFRRASVSGMSQMMS